ncbi:TPA: site-specific integrase [Legionella pneumophila]|nr:tyrosine-type recombinase/integrase [Legionella pneumophila]HCW6768427.1 tyrosine-type recombinase/integrase [Legionella pneumophila]
MTYYPETPKTTNRANHLCKVAHEFEKFIAKRGYSAPTICQYRTSADALCASLASAGNSIWELTDELSKKLITQLAEKASPRDRKHTKYRLERFRDYLIEHASAPPRAAPPIDMSSRACLRREYVAYLKEQRGLSTSTIKHCLRFHDLFFTYMFGADLGNPNDIDPEDVTSFILERRGSAPRDKTIPSHLSNLFKFLFWSGCTKRDLSKSIPSIKQPKPTQIPRYLPPDEVEQLLNAARNNIFTGRRNYAMLLMIARLGLRAPEVVAIELDDIDWRSGEILIRGKGQLHDRIPLPKDIGEAIVDYIRNDRRGSERSLFVSLRPPFKKFKDAQILRYILEDAYEATGIKPPQSYIGSHILRHSLATNMLKNGASLEEIGDILRHRSPMATTIYAQHDIESLRGIARPWPAKGGV